MPPKLTSSRAQQRIFVGPIVRFRAWWWGLDSAENLARYGEAGALHVLWREWKGTMVILGCVYVFFVGQAQVHRATTMLESIELNRQRYYDKPFGPSYVEGAPKGVYDGVQGYTGNDEATNLKVNADRRIVSNETRAELKQRLAKAEVSTDMLHDAKRLLNSPRYQSGEE